MATWAFTLFGLVIMVVGTIMIVLRTSLSKLISRQQRAMFGERSTIAKASTPSMMRVGGIYMISLGFVIAVLTIALNAI